MSVIYWLEDDHSDTIGMLGGLQGIRICNILQHDKHVELELLMDFPVEDDERPGINYQCTDEHAARKLAEALVDDELARQIRDGHIYLRSGNRYPYDLQTTPKEPSDDWMHSAARGIFSYLNDCRGIKQELGQVDHDVRGDLVAMAREIIAADDAARVGGEV